MFCSNSSTCASTTFWAALILAVTACMETFLSGLRGGARTYRIATYAHHKSKRASETARERARVRARERERERESERVRSQRAREKRENARAQERETV